jgi:hypothetical protein
MSRSADLDAAITIIIVDAYGDDEQHTAFLTVLAEQTPLPAEATSLGIPVVVTGIDYSNEARGLTATCRSPGGNGAVAMADLMFPPETEKAPAAARHCTRTTTLNLAGTDQALRSAFIGNGGGAQPDTAEAPQR